jgi:glycine cleavage system H lipoate-binding protein
MNCPFFKEQRVKFCSLSGYRKMILLDGADTAHEVCSGPSYPECSLLRKAAPGPNRPASVRSVGCPSLHESLVQYCTAAAFRKFVPASEPSLLRCGRPAFRYCDLYRETAPVGRSETGFDLAPGLCVPAHLGYARNHMWMDQIGTRQCQIGIDAFLAGVVGTVEQLSFLTVAGVCRPTVVLRRRGVDLHLVFPARMAITAANLYLRARPSRLTEDAYGAGWLFEGEPQDPGRTERSLLRAMEAASWMKEESRRLGAWVQERVPDSDGRPVLTLGTTWLDDLSREDVLALFDEFFRG